jgi:hypothetical protein
VRIAEGMSAAPLGTAFGGGKIRYRKQQSNG